MSGNLPSFKRLWRVAFMVALLCCATVAVWAKKKGTMKQECAGSYQVDFRGALSGTGTATVTTKLIQISGTLKDAAGNGVPINVQLQVTDDGHISSSSSTGGVSITISGRIDPSASEVKVPRVNCTYKTSTGQFGRMVGHRTGDAPPSYN